MFIHKNRNPHTTTAWEFMGDGFLVSNGGDGTTSNWLMTHSAIRINPEPV